MLVPQLLTKEPVLARCLELTICGCKESGSQCSTRQCWCRKSGIFCSGACGCACAAWCTGTPTCRGMWHATHMPHASLLLSFATLLYMQLYCFRLFGMILFFLFCRLDSYYALGCMHACHYQNSKLFFCVPDQDSDWAHGHGPWVPSVGCLPEFHFLDGEKHTFAIRLLHSYYY